MFSILQGVRYAHPLEPPYESPYNPSSKMMNINIFFAEYLYRGVATLTLMIPPLK